MVNTQHCAVYLDAHLEWKDGPKRTISEVAPTHEKPQAHPSGSVMEDLSIQELKAPFVFLPEPSSRADVEAEVSDIDYPNFK